MGVGGLSAGDAHYVRQAHQLVPPLRPTRIPGAKCPSPEMIRVKAPEFIIQGPVWKSLDRRSRMLTLIMRRGTREAMGIW